MGPVLIAAVAWLGCGRSREPEPAAGYTSVAATSVDTSRAAPRAAWRRMDWEPHSGLEPIDYGIGVAFLRVSDTPRAAGTVDTLLLRAAPDTTAPAVGAMLFVAEPNGAWRYAIAAPDSLRPNLLEYGYEESGVPFDSTDASGRWVRALLGERPTGDVLTGWADVSSPMVGTERWATRLAEQMIFFREESHAAFFATADSTQPVSPPTPGEAYAMHPVQVRGRWMQVRVVEPTDNCVEPDSVSRTIRTLWIRYLDDRGRPAIWYYTRGC